jgi:two-component system alkaline phosphatase synthesis response regulator PhoP
MVFVVEDDHSIRELVLYSLRNSGLDCAGFANGEEFFAELKNSKPDLVILEIMLPKEDGLSILKKIRKMRTIAETPVIMLTAKDTEYDVVVGLDSGADDYIKKPFGVMELIARVKRLIERTKKTANTETKLSFETIEIDIPKHLVSIGGKEIVLSLKEFDLLCFLMRNKNIVHSRETLLSQVWGYDYATETRTIDAHVMSLRQKLGDEGKFVQTIRGVGYKIGGIE